MKSFCLEGEVKMFTDLGFCLHSKIVREKAREKGLTFFWYY